MPDNTSKEEELTQKINKLEREIADSKRKSAAYSKQTRKETEGTNKAAIALASAMRDVNSSFRDIGTIWIGSSILPGLAEMAGKLVQTSKELHRNIVNAGMLGNQLSNAKSIVSDLQIGFGASYTDAAKVVGVLSQKQYVGNLKEAATASYQFARATGLGYEEVANLTVGLQKEGQIGSKAMTAMYADLLKIQQSNGLTKNGMIQTINTIQKMSNQMRAFGKTETEIRKMASSTGKLISSLEKVGVTADWAAEFIGKMTNPENIEENIAAYSQLGISISDALSGNFDMGQMQNGLKEFGQKLKQMGPIAGAAYAKSFGISYKEAIKAADMQGATEEQLTPEETAAQSLKELTENTKNIAEKIGDVANKNIGRIMKFGPVVLTILAVLKKPIMNFISSLFDSVTKKAQESAKEVGEVYSSKNSELFDELMKKQDELSNAKKNDIDAQTKKLKKQSEEQSKALLGYTAKQIAGAKAVAQSTIDALGSEVNKLSDDYLDNMAKLQKRLDTAKKLKDKKEKERIEELMGVERKRHDEAIKDLDEQLKKAREVQNILKDAKPKKTYREKAISKGQRQQRRASIKMNMGKNGIFLPDGEEKKGRSFLKKVGETFALAGIKIKTAATTLIGGAADIAVAFGKGVEKTVKSVPKSIGGFFNGIQGKIKEALRIKSPEEKAAKKEAREAKKKERKENGEKSGLGKALGGFGKVLGIFGVIAGLLSTLMSSFPEFQETLKDLKTNLLEALKKFLAPLMNVFKKIMPVVAGALSMLLNTLGPIIQEVVECLGNLIGTLFKDLAPMLGTIIKLVGFILKPIMDILKIIMPLISDLLKVIMVALMPVLGIIGVVLRVLKYPLMLISKVLQLILKPITWLAEKFGKKNEIQENNDLLKKNNESLEKSSEAQAQEVSTDKNGNIWIKKATSSGETVSTPEKTTSTSATANTKSDTSRTLADDIDEILKRNNEHLIIAMREIFGKEDVWSKEGWQLVGNAFRNGFTVNIVENETTKKGKTVNFGEYVRE